MCGNFKTDRPRVKILEDQAEKLARLYSINPSITPTSNGTIFSWINPRTLKSIYKFAPKGILGEDGKVDLYDLEAIELTKSEVSYILSGVYEEE